MTPRSASSHEREAMKTFLTAIATLFLTTMSAVPLAAQLSVAVEGVNDPSALGDTLVFDSDAVGQRVAKRVFLNFDPGGDRSVTLRGVKVKGSSDFSYEISDVTRLPILIRNEQRLEMFIYYLPTGPGPAEALIEIDMHLDGSDLDPGDTVYSLNVVGRVPAYALTYALPGQSARAVSTEGRVDFGNSGLNVPTEAALILTNKGSGPGILRDIVLSGSAAYRMVGPPALPARIEPGRSISIQMTFTPTRTEEYTAQMTLDFGALKYRYGLAGTGGDLLRYSLRRDYPDGTLGPPESLQSGTTIEFDQGETAIEVTGTNIRQGRQLVNSISISGPFSIANLPTLPASLQNQGSLTVRITAKPGGTGTATGTLLMGDAHFPLSLHLPALSGLSFGEVGGNVDPKELVPVTLSIDRPYPHDLAGVVSLQFLAEDFKNDPSVQLSTGGQQVAFDIARGSTAATFATGVNEVSFQASGVPGKVVLTASIRSPAWGLDLTPGDGPEIRYTVDVPDAPTLMFSRTGGSVDPAALVPLQASLGQPYPVDITGVLSVEFVPVDFDNDPGVEWSTGSRQISFEIPGGSTSATFDGGLTEATFRAAAAEGEVVVTATLKAEDWGVDLTEDTRPEARFSVNLPETPVVQFSRSDGPVDPAVQVPLSVSVEQPYPVDIAGALTVDFVPVDFGSDPGVAWSTGGRQISFEIPGGSTAATFDGGLTEATFRSAKATGEMVVRATLRADDWGLDLTEDDQPEVRFSVEIPALPAVSFSRSGETVAAADQIPLSLSIAEAYATDIIGLVSLNIETQVVVGDPAVQWVTGGRDAAFHIPKGSTDAFFLTGNTDTNLFQTGTIAGEIVATARLVSINEAVPRTLDEALRLESAIDVTPDSQPQARFVVIESAPVIQRVTLGSTAQGRFSVVITGYATSRAVDTLSFAFTGTPGSLLRTPTLESSVTERFRTYYGGNQSTAYGSQFTATVEFMLDEGVFEDIDRVDVTAANSSGTSGSMSLDLN